ncbi:MAG: hypothetical protein CK426_08305 [Legionella sp.]|nr:MAG: hypothetical protein CK423_01210 [Legionella sp.]PJD97431.1 MAG: hypothetical protein CK426_08305 [Legionella sp.]
MTDKPSTIELSSAKNYSPDRQALSVSAMDVANFSFTVFATSSLIALVHSPINTLLMNYLKTGKLINTQSESSLSLMILMKQFYTGFAPCLAGTGTRTTYMSGAKKMDQHNKMLKDASGQEESAVAVEPQKQEQGRLRQMLASAGYISAMSLGEVAVTQVPEVLSTLRKAEVIGPEFKWYAVNNFVPLAKASCGARFTFGFINFLSLCDIEKMYARHLAIENQTTKHFSAGMLSGMTAAILSYPFAHYRDYYLTRMTWDGKQLQGPGVFNLLKEFKTYAKEVGFYSVMKTMGKEFICLAPWRAAKAGTRFGLIAGVSTFLGDKPCNNLLASTGFFASVEPEERFAAETIDKKPTNTPT